MMGAGVGRRAAWLISIRWRRGIDFRASQDSCQGPENVRQMCIAKPSRPPGQVDRNQGVAVAGLLRRAPETGADRRRRHRAVAEVEPPACRGQPIIGPSARLSSRRAQVSSAAKNTIAVPENAEARPSAIARGACRLPRIRGERHSNIRRPSPSVMQSRMPSAMRGAPASVARARLVCPEMRRMAIVIPAVFQTCLRGREAARAGRTPCDRLPHRGQPDRQPASKRVWARSGTSPSLLPGAVHRPSLTPSAAEGAAMPCQLALVLGDQLVPGPVARHGPMSPSPPASRFGPPTTSAA